MILKYMNPALIVDTILGFCAYNEDSRQIAKESSWHWCNETIKAFGYCGVSSNSRLGKTIFDKLPLDVQLNASLKHQRKI